MEETRFIYFTAKWCGPCQTFKPIMEGLEQEGYPIYFQDIDDDPILAESYQIKSVPTIKIVQGDKVLETMVGIQDPNIMVGKFQLYAPLDFDSTEDES